MSIFIRGGVTGNLLNINSRLAALVASADTDAPTYVASVSAQANTAASDSIAIESGAALVTRLRRLIIWHCGKQTTAGIRLLTLIRTTTVGTGGAFTPPGSDQTEIFSGIVRAKPTALGTAGVTLLTVPLFVPTALAAFTPLIFDLDALGLAKSFKIPVGVANGISLRDPGAAGCTDFSAMIVFTEETT